jgi:maltose alpha-D-glucosyltransferase/alpha-amylase
MAYQPSWADGDLDALKESDPELYEEGEDWTCAGDGRGDLLGAYQSAWYPQWLGVGGFWPGPWAEHAGMDGPYSPVDHRRVAPLCGNDAILRALVREYHRRGMVIGGDLVLAHTSDQHPMFVAAREDPEGEVAQMYYIFPWEEHHRYDSLSSVFIDESPQPYSYLGVVDGREWGYVHRFYPDQPALRGDHPAVREFVLANARHMVGQGVDLIRGDAAMYAVSTPGTRGEHEPGAIDLAAFIQAGLDGVYCVEAAGHRAVVAPYLQPGRARLCWCFETPPEVFYAIATRDLEPLRAVYRNTPRIAEDAHFGNLLRGWDELQLAFQAEERREVMLQTLGIAGRYRTHTGLKQSLADLAGSEAAAVMLFELNLFQEGVPFFRLGDELATLGDRESWERWAVRYAFAWDEELPNAGFSRATGRLFSELSPDWRRANVARQRLDPASPLRRNRRAILLHNRLPALHAGRQQEIGGTEKVVLSFARLHDGARSSAPPQEAICLINFSGFPLPDVQPDLRGWRGSRLMEYCTDPRVYRRSDTPRWTKAGWVDSRAHAHDVGGLGPWECKLLVPETSSTRLD